MRWSKPSTLADARNGFLILTIAALVVALRAAYSAARNERTGKASYSLGKGRPRIHVTRDSDPVKFRQVTNFRWGLSIMGGLVAGITFSLYRKCDDDPLKMC